MDWNERIFVVWGVGLRGFWGVVGREGYYSSLGLDCRCGLVVEVGRKELVWSFWM